MYENLPKSASNFVDDVDKAFLFIIGISIFFLVAITVTMIYFIMRYRKEKNPVATQIEGSTKLEIVWTVIPTIIVMFMFYYGWAGWKPMTQIPEDNFPITSVSRMWSWSFEYPNGRVTDTLYVPEGENIKLDLVAADVIHSLYIPAFRVKQDMIPGTDSEMWFNSEKPGEYDLFCAEYCGLRHSYMATSVIVLPQDEFDKWYNDSTLMETAATMDPKLAGLAVLRKNGCNACHSMDGSKLVGPSYKGLWGMPRMVETDGEMREVIADEEYIKRAIYEPNADIVEGYQKGMMLSYKDMVTEEELESIITYFKSL